MEVVPTPDQRPLTRDDQVAWQLAGLERRIEALTERVGRLEATLRDSVAEEVRGATDELRRAMSELGRRLVQDLPHELRRHRDAIVAELRPPPPPPPPPEPEPALEEPPVAERFDPAPAPEAAETPEAPETPETPEQVARRRASRLRRRLT